MRRKIGSGKGAGDGLREGRGKEMRTTRRKLPTGFALSISHRVLAPNALEGGWRDGVGRCAVYGEETEEKMGEETAAE